jgi:hypothetical protein
MQHLILMLSSRPPLDPRHERTSRCHLRSGWLWWRSLSGTWCAQPEVHGLGPRGGSDTQGHTSGVLKPVAAGIGDPSARQSEVGAAADHHRLARRRRGAPADPEPVVGTGGHDDLEIGSCLDEQAGLGKQSRHGWVCGASRLQRRPRRTRGQGHHAEDNLETGHRRMRADVVAAVQRRRTSRSRSASERGRRLRRTTRMRWLRTRRASTECEHHRRRCRCHPGGPHMCIQARRP